MKYTELIPGEIYCQKYEESKNEYIFLFTHYNEKRACGKYFINTKISYFDTGYINSESGSTIRLATDEEKRWLNYCIEINDYISYEKLPKVESYDIY